MLLGTLCDFTSLLHEASRAAVRIEVHNREGADTLVCVLCIGRMWQHGVAVHLRVLRPNGHGGVSALHRLPHVFDDGQAVFEAGVFFAAAYVWRRDAVHGGRDQFQHCRLQPRDHLDALTRRQVDRAGQAAHCARREARCAHTALPHVALVRGAAGRLRRGLRVPRHPRPAATRPRRASHLGAHLPFWVRQLFPQRLQLPRHQVHFSSSTAGARQRQGSALDWRVAGHFWESGDELERAGLRDYVGRGRHLQSSQGLAVACCQDADSHGVLWTIAGLANVLRHLAKHVQTQSPITTREHYSLSVVWILGFSDPHSACRAHRLSIFEDLRKQPPLLIAREDVHLLC
mmetsp:Transcript_35241/g.74032  ORF Transcript_35241/g.74032 Transcript_35241/m.74032 type:complete len:345 (+) Transcript_35241:488-1522(+)